LKQHPERWIDFMMRFELGLEKPDASALLSTPLTIGFSYIIGESIPLLPYILYNSVSTALSLSVIVTLAALAVFGALKGAFTGVGKLKSAFQTTMIGGLAAGVAYLIANLLGG
jgi:vacuolar iron transporter family protein